MYLIYMNISIIDLKKNLSRVFEQAASGVKIIATKHNKPFVAIVPISSSFLAKGKRFGKEKLKSAIQLDPKMPSTLEVLQKDRETGGRVS